MKSEEVLLTLDSLSSLQTTIIFIHNIMETSRTNFSHETKALTMRLKAKKDLVVSSEYGLSDGSSINSSFCAACQALFKSIELLEPAGRFDLHHVSNDSCKRGASQDCHLCCKLVNDPILLGSRRQNETWNCHKTRSENDTWTFTLYTYSGIKFYAVPISGMPHMRLWKDELDPVETLTNTRSSVSLAKTWLQNCEKHEKCNDVQYDNSFLPTRLIHIGKGRMPHLAQGADISSDFTYFTLSHCWGESIPLTLQTHNLTAMRLEIPFRTLPRTFQDAIIFTRAMGVEYLWIDALCIIQDSVQDWQHEAALMKEVYRNGRCNLSATGSIDSRGGLFFDRDTKNIEVSLRSSNSRPETYCLVEDNVWSRQVEKSRLNKRGWVLQERVLSRRNIHFGPKQLLWECPSVKAWENALTPQIGVQEQSKPGNKDPFSSPFKSGYAPLLYASAQKFISTEVNGRTTSIYFMWSTLVEIYSQCLLTKPSDRLVAISGLASLFNGWLSLQLQLIDPIHELRYLAGLWSYDLHPQLLWQVVKMDIQAAGSYVAPSWSWAAAEIPIRNPRGVHSELKVSSILSVSTTPHNTQEPFGHVSAGTLNVMGKLATYDHRHIQHNSDAQKDSGFVTRSTTSRMAFTKSEGFFLGLDREISTDIVMYLLPMRFMADKDLSQEGLMAFKDAFTLDAPPSMAFIGHLEGLILKSTETSASSTKYVLPSAFNRIGYWRFDSTSFTQRNNLDVLLEALSFTDSRNSSLMTETCEEVRALGLGNKAFKISIV